MLSIRLDDRKQPVRNKRFSEEVVLDLGKGGVGIEILDASRHLNLESVLPIEYVQAPGT